MDNYLPSPISPTTTTSGIVTNAPSTSPDSSMSTHTSSRSAAQDPAFPTPLPGRFSPFLDFGLDIRTTDIKDAPNTFPDVSSDTNMDRSPFQSSNDRRSNLANEGLPGNQFQYTRQQPQQPPVLPQAQGVRPGISAPPSHHRGITSTNWRSHGTEDAPLPQPLGMHHHFDAIHPRSFQDASVPPMPFPNNRVDEHQNDATSNNQRLSLISDAQVEGIFAYCYDRGNGQYTRLIPADTLHFLRDIPALEQSCSGMIIVPQPRAVPPEGLSTHNQHFARRSAPSTPPLSADTIQSRIDDIVATTPPTPAHAPGHPTGASSGQRRPKIYCDKWVHEGVCAFTQQGCKYKHEMPTDKATQISLGLFQGYPAWWKKLQAELGRQRDMPLPEAPKNGGQNNQPKLMERYAGRNHTTAPGRAGRGGGLGMAPDTGAQLAWRPSHGYNSNSQPLVPAPAIGRTTASRDLGSTATDTSAVSNTYGSPYGPICPPTRGNAAPSSSTEAPRSPRELRPALERRAMPQDTRRSSPTAPNFLASSTLASTNPFASLDALDDNGDHEKGVGLRTPNRRT